MMFCDYHVHSTYSDGKHTPAEIASSAYAMGVSFLGFSDHSPFPFSAPYGIDPKRINEYYHEIASLKKEYKGRMTLLCGIELDIETTIDLSVFDYRIGSVHYLKLGSEYCEIDGSPDTTEKIINDYFSGDPYAYASAYYARVSELFDHHSPDIIGHFDLLTKFTEARCLLEEDDPRYRRAWSEAVDALLQYDKPFEINTGAMSRGWRTSPYPSSEILHYLRARGGKIIFGSDCHDQRNLCHAFPQAKELALSCGFTSCIILTEHGMDEVSL